MEKFKKVLTEDFIRSSPIWGSKVKKLLIDKLRSANEYAAEGNWGPLVALRNHVALQVQSYRLTSKKQSVPKGDFRLRNLPEAYGRGELYTRPHSNVDENRLVEGLKRSLNFQSVMASTARPDLRIRGGITSTEMRELDPGIYTGDDFDYLREQEEEQRERYRDRLHARRVRIDRAKNWANNKRTEHWQRVREDNLYRKDMESRHSRMRRQQQAAFQYDTMDEYERFIHEGKKKYGSKEKAAEVYAKQNAKWLHSLAKNNPIIAKNLPQIAKGLQHLTKIPYLGGAIAHPGLAAFGLGTFALSSYISYLKNTALTGASSKRAGVLTEIARSAEIELKEFGGDASSYTSPVHSFRAGIGKLFTGTGGSEFLTNLAKFGVDITGTGMGGLATGRESIANIAKRIQELHQSGMEDQAIALADVAGFDRSMYAISVSHGSNINKVLESNVDTTKITRGEYAQESGRFLIKVWEQIKESLARGAIDPTGRLYMQQYREAEKAAKSAEVYESSGGSNINNTTSQSNTVNINIENVHADNAQEFASNLKDNTQYLRADRIGVVEYFDTRKVA